MVDGLMEQTDMSPDLELDAALRAFGEAWAKGDAEALRSLLSPSYTHNDASGEHLTCEQWLAYATRRAGRATQIKFRDVKTRLFGDLAVITGFNDLTGGGVFEKADRRDMSLVFLQVWRRENGRWLREAFQATPVTTEGYS
jgi:predicted alpha-1,6-mannanase (GH76 family)